MPKKIKKEKKVPGRGKKVIKDVTKSTPQRFPGNRSRVKQEEP